MAMSRGKVRKKKSDSQRGHVLCMWSCTAMMSDRQAKMCRKRAGIWPIKNRNRPKIEGLQRGGRMRAVCVSVWMYVCVCACV